MSKHRLLNLDKEGSPSTPPGIAQARTSEIITTQPVINEIGRLRVPTVLMVGELDATGAGLTLADGSRRTGARIDPGW